MSRWDALWINAHLATMAPTGERYGAVPRAALAVRDGRIAWLGPIADLPGGRDDARVVHDAGGAWITPGLIDCHTHLVFGGNRADEFEARLEGASYEDLARAGGGIRSTVRATRQADGETLFQSAFRRLEAVQAEGVTTVEIKSGYGLDLETELRMLRVARRIGRERPLRVRTTFLGAHALPEEFEGRSSDYIESVVEEMMPAVVQEGLADACDAFCEGIGFSPQECARVFEAARTHGLDIRLHADQLSDLGGAALAARFGARSADHLEYTSESGVAAMAESGTIAVLLPGAFYFVRETQKPPVQAFRERGVPIALATDANPGSSPLLSILLTLNLACTLFHLTPEEALAAVTRNAAAVLGLEDDVGTLSVGKVADLAIWDVHEPGELAYWIGGNPIRSVVKDGRPLSGT